MFPTFGTFAIIHQHPPWGRSITVIIEERGAEKRYFCLTMARNERAVRNFEKLGHHQLTFPNGNGLKETNGERISAELSLSPSAVDRFTEFDGQLRQA